MTAFHVDILEVPEWFAQSDVPAGFYWRYEEFEHPAPTLSGLVNQALSMQESLADLFERQGWHGPFADADAADLDAHHLLLVTGDWPEVEQ